MNTAEAKALIDFEAYCESRFPVGDPTASRLSVTGEEYIQFSPARTKEGELRGIFDTLESAISAAKIQFDEYASTRQGTIYWRIRPEIEVSPKQPFGWMFYMRLLISDKPRNA